MVSMNRLSTEKRAQIVGCLVEGNSAVAGGNWIDDRPKLALRSRRSKLTHYQWLTVLYFV